jgi:hypothetical protein
MGSAISTSYFSHLSNVNGEEVRQHVRSGSFGFCNIGSKFGRSTLLDKIR